MAQTGPPNSNSGRPLSLHSSRSQQSYQSRQRTQPGNAAVAVSALGHKHKLWFTGVKDGAGHAQCLHFPDQVRTE